MEDSQLTERIEGFATWFVNEDSLLDDRRHDTIVDEVTDDLSRRRLVDVRRRHLGCIPVLCEEFGLGPLIIISSVVEYIWTALLKSFTLDTQTCEITAHLRAF